MALLAGRGRWLENVDSIYPVLASGLVLQKVFKHFVKQ